MWTQIKYILFITIGLACFRNQLFAQASVQNKSYSPLQIDETSFEAVFHQPFLALKIAKSTLEDSIAASRLDKIGYLAIAQSRFSPSQIDINQRTGYWMLSYPVAIKYGLIVNTIIDERKNLAKSTKAAYLYWLDLVQVYKNESIADLAFVESAITISKMRIDSLNNAPYWGIISAKNEQLKQLKKIYKESNYKDPNSKSVVSKVSTVWVRSSAPISFAAIHHFTQIPTVELSRLNPQWINNRYNPTYGALKLPLKYQTSFEEDKDAMEQKTRNDKLLMLAENTKRLKHLKGNIPDLNRYKPIRYKVKMGDNLGRIAQRHHVKISSIRAWNELKSDRIYAGQKLTIYVPTNQKVALAKKVPEKVKKVAIKEGKYQAYTVKTGDTLWGISQLFERINADMIMEDNGIDENISPGQVLKIRTIE